MTEIIPIKKLVWICRICNKKYSNSSGLWKHNNTHHNNKETIKRDLLFCIHCNAKFNSHTTRWRHEKICTMNKPEPKTQSDELAKKVEQMEKSIEILQKNTTHLTTDYQDDWETTQYFQFNKIKLVPRKSDSYIDIVPICTSTSTSLDTWLSFESTKSLIAILLKSIPIYKLIYNESDSKIFVHPELAKQLVTHANPLYGTKFTKWMDNLIEKSELLIESDDEEDEIIDSSSPYPPNVIYILTNEFNKTNRTYIVGKTQNLKSRLCTYNKSTEHEVVYYKQCSPQVLKLCESMLLKKLAPYRIAINRDRFILPTDKPIDFFTKHVDEAVSFF
jgi:hypothetical protein